MHVWRMTMECDILPMVLTAFCNDLRGIKHLLLIYLSVISGQRMLTKGRVAPPTCHPHDGWVHSEASLSLWCAVPCIHVCSPVLLQHLLLRQSDAFQWARRPPNLPLPLGGLGPTWHMISLAHPSLYPKRHVYRFIHFCKGYSCVDTMRSNS